MIIKNPPKITNRNSFLSYLEVELWSWLKALANGLLKISFSENFQSFTVTNILIKAGKEVAIPNQFNISYPGNIPSGRIIIRQIGDANIIDGDTIWNANHVFLKNPSGNDATVSILFYK